MTTDPLIQDVRSARHEISEECDHDIWKLYERYDTLQREMKAKGTHRFVDAPPQPSAQEEALISK